MTGSVLAGFSRRLCSYRPVAGIGNMGKLKRQAGVGTLAWSCWWHRGVLLCLKATNL